MCSEKLTACQRIELRIEAIARRLDKLMAQWRTMLGDA